MAIDLDGGNGLFDMLGKLVNAQNVADTFRNGSLVTEANDALVVMDGSTPSMELRSDWSELPSVVLSAQDGLNAYVEGLRSTAEATVIRLADEDDPLPELTIELALKELIEQMVAGTETVDANEPTASLSYSASITGTTGKGRAGVSLVDGRGRVRQFVYDEILDATVTSVNAGAESTFDVLGEASADFMAAAWPAGSGANGSVIAFDAAGDNNLIVNGTLDDFTTNLPDGFTKVSGTAGTDFSEETSTVFIAGGSALVIAAGGNAVALLSTDSIDLDAHTQYALGFWYRRTGTVSGGTLDVSLYDGSNDITDEAGTTNTVQIAFGDLTTSWQLATAFFRLPDPAPATVKLRIRTGTAFSGGGTVYVDHLMLAQVDELYQGGPFLSVFAGSAPFELDDKITLDVGNDYRGAIQTAFHRNFDMVALDLYLPSATGGSETIADSLIG